MAPKYLASDQRGSMMEATELPIGTEIIENGADFPRMTHLCRYGYTPIQSLPGGSVRMRRDFHKLLTQEELLDQILALR